MYDYGLQAGTLNFLRMLLIKILTVFSPPLESLSMSISSSIFLLALIDEKKKYSGKIVFLTIYRVGGSMWNQPIVLTNVIKGH